MPSNSTQFTAADKIRVRSLTARAIASGKLVPRSCEHCGDGLTEAHHPDYSKPLEVQWLCSYCHAAVHRRTSIAKSGAQRQKEYRERQKGKLITPDFYARLTALEEEIAPIQQLRNDVNTLSELFERVEAIERKIEYWEEVARTRRG